MVTFFAIRFLPTGKMHQRPEGRQPSFVRMWFRTPHLEPLLDGQFEAAVEKILDCKGRVVISGIGKSAIVGQKIVATMNSTGTPAIFMHAADAIHGDLGMVQEQDLVMIISKSGQSPEVKMLLSFIRNFGNTLIGMVGNLQSVLAKQADIVLNTTVSQEACLNNLAPTSSTTVQMVMGDALAVTLMEIKEPPDPRREEILPVVRYAVERKIAAGKPDYWDYATRLELAVLAKDEDKASQALSDAVANVGFAAVPPQWAVNKQTTPVEAKKEGHMGLRSPTR